MKTTASSLLHLAAAAALLAGAAGGRAAAPPPGPPPVKARITIIDKPGADEQTLECLLVAVREQDLVYRPPNVPEGVTASLPLAKVVETSFDFSNDVFAVYKAARERNYAQAAGMILRAVRPYIPFVAAPENNAAEAVFEAGGYLDKTADQQRRLNTPEMLKYAETNWTQAQNLFTNLMEAVWYPKAERARLMAARAATARGRLDEATALLADARDPGPDDEDYGLHWLTRAQMAYARKDLKAALAAAVHSVVFENKDETFPEALLLSGRCYEELLEVHRARDVYYELARLFATTEQGEEGRKRLEFLVKSGQLQEKEQANIAKVFFGTEEDMDDVVKKFLAGVSTSAPRPAPRPAATNQPPQKQEEKSP